MDRNLSRFFALAVVSLVTTGAWVEFGAGGAMLATGVLLLVMERWR